MCRGFRCPAACRTYAVSFRAQLTITSADMDVLPHREATMTEIVERPLQSSSLPTLNWHGLCWNFYDGNCRLEDQCPRNHTICQVQGTQKPSDTAPLLHTKANHLALSPRVPHAEGPFDEDGPADLTWLGPRHNNDHSEVGQHYVLLVFTLIFLTDPSYPYAPNNRRNPCTKTALYAVQGPGRQHSSSIGNGSYA